MQNTETSPLEDKTTGQDLRLPDFFIIGSAKCGTTTLYKYLCRHPDVFMSTPKEMSYFSKDNVYQRGLQWYANLFSAAMPHQICGEASTTYSRWPLYDKTVERLAAVQPEPKVIYLVRDPADRLFSFYAHRMRETVTMTFDQFLAETPEAIDSGRYMTQINQYLEVFSEEQILVLFTKDLKDDPGLVLDSTRTFLGLADFDFLQAGPIQANEGGGKFYAASTLTRAIGSLKRAPGMGSLISRVPSNTRKAGYEWLANGPIGRKLRRRHRNNMSTMTPKQRQQIQELYHDEIEQLEDFTGRDLTAWKDNST